jgi:NNP family nitrate/nitrite transporter-like MFS transporter
VGLLVLGAGAGLYPSSGIATVSSLVESRDEGKVLSLHESGPILGFIIAPLVVALLLPAVSWRGCLLIISALGILIGMSFVIFSRGGDFRGKAPVLRNVTRILALPSFWIIALFMAMGAGSSIGLFSVIPTYLVFERGLDHGLVNTLVGVSRISGLVVLWFTGYLVDRYGAKMMICVILLSAGVATVALGARSQAILVVAVFLQPLLIVSFFPAVLTAAARIAPRNYQNLTVSLMLSIGYGIGSGLVPLLLGWLGDNASFALGFVMYGVLLVVGSVLPFLLKLEYQE